MSIMHQRGINTHWRDSLNHALGMADKERKEISVLWDLNTNFQDKRSYQPLHAITSQYQLEQLVNGITLPISGKTIHLINTSEKDRVIKSGVLDIGLSDHLQLIFIMKKIKVTVVVRITNFEPVKVNEDGL